MPHSDGLPTDAAIERHRIRSADREVAAMDAREHATRMQLYDVEANDVDLLAKALREYRPETTEEEAIKYFYIEQLEKLR